MPKGIIVFGGNGCGKSTIGRELADILNYKYMDIEDYYFVKSKIPYSITRSREDCLALMLDDINKHGSFVISAVNGDFGGRINYMYECAIFMSAPLEVRLERIKKRAYEQYGKRIYRGGDMFEQEQKFYNFVSSRSLSEVEHWSETLLCPVIRVDAVKSVQENIKLILSQYKALSISE